MKRSFLSLLFIICSLTISFAQGWPEKYTGVMLQAFSWDSYDETNWNVLTDQADELSSTFDLVWLPQSGNCGGQSMGYDDLYWFNNYNSSFGNESELRNLISTFKAKGIKTIADVVVNHRKSNNGWFGFPTETYKGVTYSMGPSDVCSDDDGGKADTEAKKLGVTLGKKDTGEGWDGMRDLDHTSENVQNTVKAYVGFLKNDLGYAGFRYDMVKGFSAKYVGMYNASSSPEFSVGECWDAVSTITNWINGTKVDGIIQSAAFDFDFKYVVTNATKNQDWSDLGKQNGNNWPMISTNWNSGQYRRYAVTFVENHDTQLRNDGSSHGPLEKDTLAANAFLMAMPGTPCVFQPHWLKYSTEIKAMVAARKQAGVHSECTYSNSRSNKNYFANTIKNDGKNCLLVAIGDFAAYETAASSVVSKWVKVISGYHYAYYFPKTMETAYVDLASSIYEGEKKATLTAVTESDGAQLVYTTDGSNPKASSTKVTSGTQITIPLGTTTLKVGLLINGQVSGIITRNYTVKEKTTEDVVIPGFCMYADDEICAFFEAPKTWKNTIMCWAWSDSPAENFTSASGKWPGIACQLLGTAPNGNQVWKWKWDGTRQNNTSVAKPALIIFSNNGTPQTSNMTFKNGGYYTKEGLFDIVPASIGDIECTPSATDNTLYDLTGRRMLNGNSLRGIYIRNGKKIVVR